MTSIRTNKQVADAVFRRRVRRTAVTIAAAIAASAIVAACNSSELLDVETPSAVPVGMIDDPKNATLMVASAQADFECALGAVIAVEGLISDELADAQLGAAAWPYDRRDANTQTNGIYGTGPCTNNQNPGVYTPLSTARWDADHAIKNLTEWTEAQVPNRQTLLARSYMYAGFSYALLGMSMCAAAFDLGPAVDQKGMFTLAEQRFTDAINAAQTGAPNVLNASRVGRARVRLFNGDKAGAAADAALVTKDFALSVLNDATDNRLYNRVFTMTAQNGLYTVDPISRNLTTERGEVDPRAASKQSSTRGADNRSTIFVPNKYSAGYAAPTRVASYDEAQLILAEAQGGANAVTIINALRAAVGLQPYSGPTDAASIQNLIIDERRRALFVEGFRNYDMQRFNVPFNPAVGTTFPIKGGTYGNTRCLPLPDIERANNPNIT